MFLFPLVFVILLILGGVLVWALIKHEGPTRPSSPALEALDILEQRYARGDIDHQEFEERRQALRSEGSGTG
jgi:putative membrane protein